MRRSSIGEPLTPTEFGDLKVFSGSAHVQLAKEICDFLGIPPGQARLRRFPDSEVSFQIDKNIRGAGRIGARTHNRGFGEQSTPLILPIPFGGGERGQRRGEGFGRLIAGSAIRSADHVGSTELDLRERMGPS